MATASLSAAVPLPEPRNTADPQQQVQASVAQVWSFRVLHAFGTMAVVAPTVAPLLDAPVGAGTETAGALPTLLLQSFAEACPVADAVTAESFVWSFLVSRPPPEIFPAAEDPWFCAAAHGALLMRVLSGLLLGVVLFVVLVNVGASASCIQHVLLLWIFVGSASAWFSSGSFERLLLTGQSMRKAARYLYVAVAIGSAVLFLQLRWCGQGVAGGFKRGRDAMLEQMHSTNSSLTSLGSLGTSIPWTTVEVQAEQDFTQQLQDMYDRLDADVRRTRLEQRHQINPGVSPRPQPHARTVGHGRDRGQWPLDVCIPS